jgi:hypothetical protein
VQDVRFPAGMEVVDADHLVTIGQQTVDQMRAEKAGANRDQNTVSGFHVFWGQGAVHDSTDDLLHDDSRGCSYPLAAL